MFKYISCRCLVLNYYGLDFFPLNTIINFIMDATYDKLRLIVDLSAIIILNAEHKAAFDNAALKLQIMANSYGIDSEQFKQEKENAKLALSKFVTFNGVPDSNNS